MKIRAAALAIWILVSAACSTTGLYGAAGFRIDSNVADATVWVDDRLIGKVSDWAGEGRYIRPGFHRVEIRHPGFYSHFAEVDLQEGANVTVRAQLRPLLD